MQTLFDYMRKRLLTNVHASDYWPKADGSEKLPALDELRETEWVPEFEALMRNRCMVGAARYELMAEKEKCYEYDCADGAITRIKKFIATGNTENLVDAANLCMIEYQFSNHPNKHFKSEDDGDHTARKEK
jgi:hypothetical protein